MAGGLLNLVAYGNQNVIINGNPSKTFFKMKYAKHTNFGLQKFRIDYDGLRTLNLFHLVLWHFLIFFYHCYKDSKKIFPNKFPHKIR